MPANVVKTKTDERAWRKAKALAASEDHKEDWPYIMGIFKKMDKTAMRIPFTDYSLGSAAGGLLEGVNVSKDFRWRDMLNNAYQKVVGITPKQTLTDSAKDLLESGASFVANDPSKAPMAAFPAAGMLLGAGAGALYSMLPHEEIRDSDTGRFESPSFLGEAMTNVPIGAMLGAAAPFAIPAAIPTVSKLMANLPKFASVNPRSGPLTSGNQKRASVLEDAFMGAGIGAVGSSVPAWLHAYSEDENPDKAVAKALSYALPIGALLGIGVLPASRLAAHLGDQASSLVRQVPELVSRLGSSIGERISQVGQASSNTAGAAMRAMSNSRIGEAVSVASKLPSLYADALIAVLGGGAAARNSKAVASVQNAINEVVMKAASARAAEKLAGLSQPRIDRAIAKGVGPDSAPEVRMRTLKRLNKDALPEMVTGDTSSAGPTRKNLVKFLSQPSEPGSKQNQLQALKMHAHERGEF